MTAGTGAAGRARPDRRPSVVVVATLDTKGPEVAYLRDQLVARDLRPLVVDSGILGEPRGIEPDVDHAAVARAGGTTIEAVRAAGTRGAAVAIMRDALRTVVADLRRQGRLDAAVGLGGAEGAVMGAAALQVLPLGVPKVVISPIASGHHEFGPLVGTSDMTVVHSVTDILGLNPILTAVFDNVAGAVAGMLAGSGTDDGAHADASRAVAVTMLGNTTTAVMAAVDRLAERGYDGVVFHSNGVGGPAMEQLAEAGHFVGVIDYTTNEVTDPLVGGIHDGGPRRLARVGAAGLPQVVVPGCVDFSVFASGTVPPALAGRPTYDHNPEYTLVRTPADEMAEIGRIFADRLGEARAPVRVLVPTAGLSIPSTPDGPFWDPDADAAFLDALRDALAGRPPGDGGGDLTVTTTPHHVNDPELGRRAADALVALMEEQP